MTDEEIIKEYRKKEEANKTWHESELKKRLATDEKKERVKAILKENSVSMCASFNRNSNEDVTCLEFGEIRIQLYTTCVDNSPQTAFYFEYKGKRIVEYERYFNFDTEAVEEK